MRLGRLGGEADESVLLAAALAVRAVRLGSVCIELATAPETVAVESETPTSAPELPWPAGALWPAACAASPLVAVGPAADPSAPLRLVGGLLYLDRYWRQEQAVREALDARAAQPPPPVDLESLQAALEALFPAYPPDLQRLAAAAAAIGWVTVLAGGPGTGKTSTVAKLLALLHEQPGPPPRIALAAPTGRAAARLQEAVRAEGGKLPHDRRHGIPDLTASTLHRLLGSLPGSRSRFRHDRTNRLPYDVVVVDETSMVSLTLMSRLLDAVRPQARLILVGDPDQLASVEAGAVLGDLVARPVPVDDARVPLLMKIAAGDVSAADGSLSRGVVRLRHNWRFGGAIAELAEAVRDGEADAAVAILRAGSPAVELVDADPAGLSALREDVVSAGLALVAAARDGDVPAALVALDQHRLLCGHRRGPYGVARWAEDVERWLGAAIENYADTGQWYVGRPLLIDANDYDLRLFNGDTGVVVDAGARGLMAGFLRDGETLLVPPSRLSHVQTVHAMTVHRGQGSQFERVTLVLPPAESPLLTRELLYTAVTRAMTHVRVVGSADAVRAAVERPIVRASGLRQPLG
jgi:exodeoxyribonuclease V alpha subunit